MKLELCILKKSKSTYIYYQHCHTATNHTSIVFKLSTGYLRRSIGVSNKQSCDTFSELFVSRHQLNQIVWYPCFHPKQQPQN